MVGRNPTSGYRRLVNTGRWFLLYLSDPQVSFVIYVMEVKTWVASHREDNLEIFNLSSDEISIFGMD